MKKNYIYFLFLFCSLFANGQTISQFASGFTSLEGITVDSQNNVYVSEHDSGKIFSLASDGTSTLTTTGFRSGSLAFDNSDNLFVVDPVSRKIRQLDGSTLNDYITLTDPPRSITFYNNELYTTIDFTKIIKTASDKTSSDYATGYTDIRDIVFDEDGNVYITDGDKLYKRTTAGVQTTLVDGASEFMNGFRAVSLANDNIYFTANDMFTFQTKIVKYDLNSSTFSDYVTTNLNNPNDIAIDKLGNMYIANAGDGTVTKVYDTNLIPIVNIPDSNFKNALLNHSPKVDTNEDGKIQITEAQNVDFNLYLNSKSISDLTGIESFTNISYINIQDNNLSTINLSKNTELETLIIGFNNLTSLDLSSNTLLQSIIGYGNLLNDINITNCTLLKSVNFNSNKFTSFDISNNSLLEILIIGNNLLENFDASNNPNLNDLNLYTNKLVSLNIANGNNTILNLQANDNPNLTCITVDDVTYSNTNWNTRKDAHTSFSEDCSATLSINDDILNANITVFPNPANQSIELKLKNNTIVNEIKLIDMIGKEILTTNKSKIDISNLPSGLYLLKIKGDNNEIAVKKFIKQ